MKKLFYITLLSLCFMACDDEENGVEQNSWGGVFPLKSLLIGELVENNIGFVIAEQGGEFTLKMESPGRVYAIYEYGGSLNLPIGNEYASVDIYRNGARFQAYATYLSDRLNYGAEYNLIDAQLSYSYKLPWAFEQRSWYEVEQIKESEIRITIKPCDEYRILYLQPLALTPSYHPIDGCIIECIPASEFEANR